MEKIRVNITWLDNFGAYSDLLPGCVATNATLEGVKAAYESALQFHLDGMKEDGDEIPAAFVGEIEIEYELNAQAMLKHLDGIITRAALARVTGINERQLGHYISGRVEPRHGNRKKVLDGIRRIREEYLDVV